MLTQSDLEKRAGNLVTRIHDVYDVKKIPLQAQLIYDIILAVLIEVNNNGSERCSEN